MIDEGSQVFTASIKQDVGDPLLDFRAVTVHWVSGLFAGEPRLVANDSLNLREFGVDDFCCAQFLSFAPLSSTRVSSNPPTPPLIIRKWTDASASGRRKLPADQPPLKWGDLVFILGYTVYLYYLDSQPELYGIL